MHISIDSFDDVSVVCTICSCVFTLMHKQANQPLHVEFSEDSHTITLTVLTILFTL